MSRKSKESTGPGKGSAIGAHPASETHDPIKFKLGSNQPLGLWRQDWLLTLLLVIVTMLAYLPAWNGTPIWDDDAHLTKQELRSLQGLGRIWTQPSATQQYYPLVHTMFWVEHQLWGDWPAGYHLLNILLHCASALLLVRILRQLQIPGAWLAAAIFALHPAAALLWLVVLMWLSRRRRAPLAGVLFFVVTLFPVLGFLNVYPFRYSLVADHFQYLAGLGIITLVAAGIALLLELGRRWKQPTGYLLCIAFLASLAILTWGQSAMYTNIETLWQTTIERNPKAWMAHNNLGPVLLQKGRVDEAIVHFRKALEIETDHPDAQANLGSALLQKGELDEAIAQYYKSLEIKPAQALVHYDLGNALLLKGQVDEAVAHYEKALELKPAYADVYNNLGIVLFQKRQVDQAIAYYQKALEINPQYVQARANLAWALATSPQTPILKALAVKLVHRIINR